jgi:hypothetical protein
MIDCTRRCAEAVPLSSPSTAVCAHAFCENSVLPRYPILEFLSPSRVIMTPPPPYGPSFLIVLDENGRDCLSSL